MCPWRKGVHKETLLLQEIQRSRSSREEECSSKFMLVRGVRRSRTTMQSARLPFCAKVRGLRRLRAQAVTTTLHLLLRLQLRAMSKGGQSPVQQMEEEWKKYTEALEEFLTSLPPDLTQRCRNAFCNSVSKTFLRFSSRAEPEE